MSAGELLPLVTRLTNHQAMLRRLDSYYTGTQPLAFIHPDVRSRLGDRLPPLVINWPRVIVSAIEERLDVEGFRGADQDSADDELWGWWQANDLDEWSQMGHTDAMVHGRAFVSVWAGEGGVPRIAVESAHQMTLSYVPGTRVVASAAKVWVEDHDPNVPSSGTSRAVLYLPDRIEYYRAQGQVTGQSSVDRWVVDQPAINNPLGVVPVVPLINRPRLVDLRGESELADIVPMADAVNKLATDMMVSSEFHAMPRRWITGMEIPRNATGGNSGANRLQEEVLQKWAEAYPGKPWLAGKDVNFGQFTEASLDNFINAIQLLTGQIAAISGLPPHYLGVNADNPASADAIRSAESSLVKRAERKQRAFGGGWEAAMRLAVAVARGGPVNADRRLETIWSDPSTPSPAQKADAVVKLTQGENPIITLRQAREDLGYTPVQVDRMEAEEQAQAARAATATVAAQVAQAEALMRDQGLSQAAAFAAVGLLQAAQAITQTQPAPPAA